MTATPRSLALILNPRGGTLAREGEPLIEADRIRLTRQSSDRDGAFKPEERQDMARTWRHGGSER